MTFIQRIAARIRHAFIGDDGSASISFIATFPIFMTIVAVIVQLALMVNARITVAAAADAAARAAMTSLPDEHPENITHAALIALAPLSPEATGDAGSDGTTYANAMKKLGVAVPDTFAARYTFAAAATDVSWTPQRTFVSSKGTEVEVTVNYKVPLTVPVAMRVIQATDTTIAGVKARFWEVTGKSKLQTSHGRKAVTNDNGWPY